MALFSRDQLPHRSTLSRFLAALDEATVEALRTLFLKNLLSRVHEAAESLLTPRRLTLFMALS